MAAQPVSVLITGANRGLGLEMVRRMVEGSFTVGKLFACCREPEEPGAEALQALAKLHPDVIVVVRLGTSSLLCYIGLNPPSCSHVVLASTGLDSVGSVVGTGGLNLLINNASMLVKATLQETSSEDMQNSFSTNVIGPMNVIKEFLPHLRAAAKASGMPGMSSRKAAVVNISSFLGSMETVQQSYGLFPAVSYRVSKAGLNMLTLCAKEELKTDEILFSLMHPGWVRTEMGGAEGEVDAPENVQSMITMLASLTEEQNGAFLTYYDSTIPW